MPFCRVFESSLVLFCASRTVLERLFWSLLVLSCAAFCILGISQTLNVWFWNPTTETTLSPPGFLSVGDAVAPDLLRGAVDPLSFMAELLQTVAKSGGRLCDRERFVWDGERLFNLRVSTVEAGPGDLLDCRLELVADPDAPEVFLRFEGRAGRWEPSLVTVTGRFLGRRATFRTTITPLDR